MEKLESIADVVGVGVDVDADVAGDDRCNSE